MDEQNFEEKLKGMTKPEVNQLRHQDMLADAISGAKDKSVLSWWWISVPLYIILTLLMKTMYMPGASLMSYINDFRGREKFLALLIFIVIPIVSIIINFNTIRKIYILSGSPGSLNFLREIWFNVLILLFSFLIIIFYLL